VHADLAFKAVVLPTLAVAFLGGILTFPHALEPGRAESRGIKLNLLVGQGNGRESNDWFAGAPGIRTETSNGHLLVAGAPEGDFHLVSRPLPVFAHRRYAIELTTQYVPSTAALWVMDGPLKRVVEVFPLPASSRPTTFRLNLNTRGWRQIAIVLYADHPGVFELSRVRLSRLS
jgi:hypothetical protein